jgi:hypothetical protein
MIMGSHHYGARFGTAVANVGDLNMDGYEGKLWSQKMRIPPELEKTIPVVSDTNFGLCLMLSEISHIER